jgi:hypothetical protein
LSALGKKSHKIKPATKNPPKKYQTPNQIKPHKNKQKQQNHKHKNKTNKSEKK